jgi:hypothetical protein
MDFAISSVDCAEPVAVTTTSVRTSARWSVRSRDLLSASRRVAVVHPSRGGLHEILAGAERVERVAALRVGEGRGADSVARIDRDAGMRNGFPGRVEHDAMQRRGYGRRDRKNERK